MLDTEANSLDDDDMKGAGCCADIAMSFNSKTIMELGMINQKPTNPRPMHLGKIYYLILCMHQDANTYLASSEKENERRC
jgi:hypothetical protein